MRSTSRFFLALILALPCTATLHAEDEPASSGPLGAALAGKRILHIAAHPDDESLFAPMMAEACRFNGGTCRLVVALDDKSWGCFLNIGLRDLDKCSAMRRLEVAASAANLNASHEFYGYPEGIHNWNDAGVQRNLQALAAHAGGHAALVARFRRTLDEFRPDVVLAFDPRHGTTCHPNHRAVVKLALEAIAGLPAERRPAVWFDSDFAVPFGTPPALKKVTDGFGIVRWPGDEATPVTWYDTNVRLPDGKTGYDYLVDALRLNATQFPDVATGKVTPAPDPSLRRVPMVRLDDIDPEQPGMCEEWKSPDFEAMSARFVDGRPVPDYDGIIKSMSE